MQLVEYGKRVDILAGQLGEVNGWWQDVRLWVWDVHEAAAGYGG
jgi:hypothetical protein